MVGGAGGGEVHADAFDAAVDDLPVEFEVADPAEVEHPDDAVVVTSRVVWDGEDERSIREALEPKPAERPTGELAQRVVDWLTGHGRAASAGDIAKALPEVRRNTLDVNLTRMVKRGQLLRPAQGLYGLPGSSDGSSYTSLETS